MLVLRSGFELIAMPPLAGRYSAGLLPKLPDVSAVRRSWRNKKRYNCNFRLNLRLIIHESKLSYHVPVNFAFVLIGVSEFLLFFFNCNFDNSRNNAGIIYFFFKLTTDERMLINVRTRFCCSYMGETVNHVAALTCCSCCCLGET